MDEAGDSVAIDEVQEVTGLWPLSKESEKLQLVMDALSYVGPEFTSRELAKIIGEEFKMTICVRNVTMILCRLNCVQKVSKKIKKGRHFKTTDVVWRKVAV